MSTEMPWRPWGDPQFSPEPQPNTTRVIPMTEPRFQPPSPCSTSLELRVDGVVAGKRTTILDPDAPHWFIDGTSQKSPPFAAGYAIIQGALCHNYKTQTTEASLLPPHTTSKQAELIALTRALTLAKNLRVNIHTDSTYACNIRHSNILIWREREVS